MTTLFPIPTYPPMDFLDGSQPCREVDPEVFFPVEGGSPVKAQRICRGCEVQDECREWALTARIEFGVWGGMSMHESKNKRRRELMQALRAKRKEAA